MDLGPKKKKKKAELNMVQTQAKTAEQGNSTERLPELQVRVKDILKVSDKRQIIRNADDILKTLDPGKMQELQDNDPSIVNLQRNRKTTMS